MKLFYLYLQGGHSTPNLKIKKKSLRKHGILNNFTSKENLRLGYKIFVIKKSII